MTKNKMDTSAQSQKMNSVPFFLSTNSIHNQYLKSLSGIVLSDEHLSLSVVYIVTIAVNHRT
jgi:hypothetical protein